MMQHLAQLNATDLDKIEQQGLGSGFKFPNAKIADIISALVPYIFAIGGVLLLFYIALGGYSMMMSQGDPKALSAAKGKITAGLIGFLILFSAYWIVKIVGQMLGLRQFSNIFGL